MILEGFSLGLGEALLPMVNEPPFNETNLIFRVEPGMIISSVTGFGDCACTKIKNDKIIRQKQAIFFNAFDLMQF